MNTTIIIFFVTGGLYEGEIVEFIKPSIFFDDYTICMRQSTTLTFGSATIHNDDLFKIGNL